MITPNEIASKKFDKSMGGYKQESVDNFLLAVAEDMQTLLEDKADLEHKISILAEKLEEYRNDEDSLRDALLSAQKLGDSVIREAKSKSEMIMRDATVKSERMIDTAQKQIEREQITLIKLQKEVSAFKSKLMGIYKTHLEIINKLPSYSEFESENHYEESVKEEDTMPQDSGDTIEIPIAQIEQYTTQKEEEVERAVYYQETQQTVVEQLEEYEEDEEEYDQEKVIRSESRFGPLKFGDGFDFKKKN